ncbi:unnamed protein product [Ambrosiozyma monospora]|uniref:Unnamed protein product n=1 Tax=Ambrosiozyma monospora TaxID=43982 RepID=A0A9W6YTL6_AMBMO|nr:unnamed protein product [Ambrosiozyma monospora]
MTSHGISSRVLNMKFMRNSEKKSDPGSSTNEHETQHTSKRNKTSEWSLPSSEKILQAAKKKQRRKFRTVGYSSLNTITKEGTTEEGNDTPSIPGRRVFGAPEKPKKDEKQADDADNNNEREGEPNKSKSLLSLWTNDKKNTIGTKRKNESDGNKPKKSKKNPK